MIKLRVHFTRAQGQATDGLQFWLLMLAIAIDDDTQKREKERRAKPQTKPSVFGRR